MKFTSKIILFGEYGILLGSQALAIPYPLYSGGLWKWNDSSVPVTESERASNEVLKKFSGFLKGDQSKFGFLNLDRFTEEAQTGLIFDSSIPSGYGLGSSGALTAAIYHRYVVGPNPTDHITLKNRLAQLESYFHKVSSGIDPLTSYLNQPVLLGKDRSVEKTPDLSAFFSAYSLFLLDIPSRGNTGELVRKFMADCEDPAYRKKMVEEYVPLVDQTIAATNSPNLKQLESYLAKYSQFQHANFSGMIPETMLRHLKYGIDSGDFYIKLCGSGGGGHMLVLTRHKSETENYLKHNRLNYKLVENNHSTNPMYHLKFQHHENAK